MSKSVAYYSHTYYDVHGSFDATKCNIWYAHKTGVYWQERPCTMQRHPVVCNVHMHQLTFGRAPVASCFSHKVPSKT